VKTSPELAREIHALYPSAPILVLSDLWNLPSDIAPYVSGFVRKGEPAVLIEKIAQLLAANSDIGSGSAKTA